MVTVREATLSDADALGRVHVAAWQRAYRGGLMPDDYLDGLDPDERAEMWRQGLNSDSNPHVTAFAAEDDEGEVVGFITVGPADGNTSAEVGEVYSLNVLPEAWGKGYGRALLEAGVTALTEAEFDEAVLWVHQQNDRACDFYKQAGWHKEDETREEEVLGVRVPEVRYHRRLNDG